MIVQSQGLHKSIVWGMNKRIIIVQHIIIIILAIFDIIVFHCKIFAKAGSNPDWGKASEIKSIGDVVVHLAGPTRSLNQY